MAQWPSITHEDDHFAKNCIKMNEKKREIHPLQKLLRQKKD